MTCLTTGPCGRTLHDRKRRKVLGVQREVPFTGVTLPTTTWVDDRAPDMDGADVSFSRSHPPSGPSSVYWRAARTSVCPVRVWSTTRSTPVSTRDGVVIFVSFPSTVQDTRQGRERDPEYRDHSSFVNPYSKDLLSQWILKSQKRNVL